VQLLLAEGCVDQAVELTRKFSAQNPDDMFSKDTLFHLIHRRLTAIPPAEVDEVEVQQWKLVGQQLMGSTRAGASHHSAVVVLELLVCGQFTDHLSLEERLHWLSANYFDYPPAWRQISSSNNLESIISSLQRETKLWRQFQQLAMQAQQQQQLLCTLMTPDRQLVYWHLHFNDISHIADYSLQSTEEHRMAIIELMIAKYEWLAALASTMPLQVARKVVESDLIGEFRTLFTAGLSQAHLQQLRRIQAELM
jgi:hypothetical protein